MSVEDIGKDERKQLHALLAGGQSGAEVLQRASVVSTPSMSFYSSPSIMSLQEDTSRVRGRDPGTCKGVSAPWNAT